MIKVFIAFLLLVLSFTSYSQDKTVFFGFSSSVDIISYITVNDNSGSEYKTTANFSAGPSLRFKINDKINLTSGLFFATKNVKQDVDLDQFRSLDPNDPALLALGELEWTVRNSYIDVPISIGYNLTVNTEFSVIPTMGIVNSFILSRSINPESNRSFLATEYNSYLIATKMGVGFLLKKKAFSLYLEPQIRIYLNKVHVWFPYQNPAQLGINLSIFQL